MKHQVSELEGALLDAAVAKAEGETQQPPGSGWDAAYSTDWMEGGPIIERERIAIWHCNAEGWGALHPESVGLGGFYPGGGGAGTALDVSDGDGIAGPTPLIAAMRAFVASKFGDEVELP